MAPISDAHTQKLTVVSNGNSQQINVNTQKNNSNIIIFQYGENYNNEISYSSNGMNVDVNKPIQDNGFVNLLNALKALAGDKNAIDREDFQSFLKVKDNILSKLGIKPNEVKCGEEYGTTYIEYNGHRVMNKEVSTD